MNQHQRLRENSLHQIEEEKTNLALLDVYEPEILDSVKIQTSHKKFYSPIEYPFCGKYGQPDLAPIRDRKRLLEKQFIEGAEKADGSGLAVHDGLFEQAKVQEQFSDRLIRQKTRMVRDMREEFFQQNGQFIIQKEFFQEQLSKLANISFQENHSIKLFQKNAILSERNNQKKQVSFQIQLNLGGIWLNKHPLQNDQEKKFEEIRPFLKDYANLSQYPILPEIQKELRYLNSVKESLVDKNHQEDQFEEIEKKISVSEEKYEKQKTRMQNTMKKILIGWEEIRQIRRKTGIQTVPWKLNVKEYQINQNIVSYDIGVSQVEIPDKVVAKSVSEAEAEEDRRQKIRNEQYFIKMYINESQIGRSQKYKLQWPSFKIPIQQKFLIMVFTAPSSIKVEIIKSGFINQVIDTINLSLPGNNAKTLTSAEQKFAGATFASNGKEFRDQNKIQQKPQVPRVETSAPSGMLLYRIEWKGEGDKMPPLGIKTLEEETECTEATEGDQPLNYQELFDMKDPRLVHKSLKEKVEGEIVRSGNSLLPFIDVQSTRHLLLKLKLTLPDIEKIQIPLTEAEIRHRQDLLDIIENQKQKNFQEFQHAEQEYYSPLQDIFSMQDPVILKEIRDILSKIKIFKSNSMRGHSNIRYKITQEIVNQYIFEQMQSPIVVFFKNLFTQKRKLGPSTTHKFQANKKVDQLQVNLHIRSAKNLPIRESSFERIKIFQDQENKIRHQNQMNQFNSGGGAGFNNERFNGYGQGFFKQQPQVNMHGNTFFNAFQNQGGRGQQISYNDHHNLDRLNGMVELRFKKSVKKTRCFEGPFPQWNETLTFNYNLKSQSMTLEKIFLGNQKPMKVFIFDIIQESKPTQAIAEARIKKTKFFLGKIEIPYSFIVAVPSVSGLFKIDRPLMIFSYGIRKSGLFDFENEEQNSKTENPDLHTYINLDLFTEPLIDNMLAYNSDRKFTPGIGQSQQVLQKASDWLESLNTKRYMRLWLNNIEGKSIFICRYLSKEICPPKLGAQKSANLIERCARFVSLIPTKHNCKLLQNVQEIHMQNNDFLRLKMGEDHGILLCNYFNYIDKGSTRQSYLLIGKAFPYGKCMFVLRRDTATNNSEIWDPFKGECYFIPNKQYNTFCCCLTYQQKNQKNDISKDNCPILEISCIVSQDNIFFNCQDTLKPSTIDFNLDSEKLWTPFLSLRTKRDIFGEGGIETIQTPIDHKFYPDIYNLKNKLENQIIEYLREKLANQRKTHFRPYTFKINARLTTIINGKFLRLCETFKCDYRTSGSESPFYDAQSKQNYEGAIAELQEERQKIKNQLSLGKNLFGFPLNMTYTTKHELFEKVAQTQIHLDQNEDIEFVLSVKCFEYECHLVSVWVFIGVVS